MRFWILKTRTARPACFDGSNGLVFVFDVSESRFRPSRGGSSILVQLSSVKEEKHVSTLQQFWVRSRPYKWCWRMCSHSLRLRSLVETTMQPNCFDFWFQNLGKTQRHARVPGNIFILRSQSHISCSFSEVVEDLNAVVHKCITKKSRRRNINSVVYGFPYGKHFALLGSTNEVEKDPVIGPGP